jgi:molecular chaperone GrpE (heat shock protein)
MHLSKTTMTQSPQNLALQTAKHRREQEQLFQDLLGILDALDHACDHWQQAEQEHAQAIATPEVNADVSTAPPPLSLLQRWRNFLQTLLGQSHNIPSTLTPETDLINNSEAMTDVLTSAREGVEMIRRSLLDILRQRQVVPLEVLGKPFDPEQMYALGRQETAEVAENTVVQEIVRGYLWQNRVLRESQVMVATNAQTPTN